MNVCSLKQLRLAVFYYNQRNKYSCQVPQDVPEQLMYQSFQEKDWSLFNIKEMTKDLT